MKEIDETRAFWERVADDWDLHIGADGDANRILCSDPVLWRFAGKVDDLDVLDVGCGTGYLSRKLQRRGARVIGVDFAPRMCDIARNRAPQVDFRVDSCTELTTVDDASIDMVIANYVLMDTPDLERSIATFHRVLRPHGVCIAIFSHPCFPQGRARTSSDGGGITYHWEFPYFGSRKCVDPPWAHFTAEFIWFHRPLSDYWKAFTGAGFSVVSFEEPRLAVDGEGVDESQDKFATRPYSVAFKLRKASKLRMRTSG